MSYLKTFLKALQGKDFLVLDTETTGLDKKAKIVQIGIVHSNGEILLDTLVNPQEPIPHDAIRIHGITDEMVKDAPTWSELHSTIYNLLVGQIVVIYGMDYDTRLMNQSGSNWSKVAGKYLCAMEAYAEHFGSWNSWHRSYTWQKLSNAAANEGIIVENAHNALGDCLMTLGVVKAMLKGAV